MHLALELILGELDKPHEVVGLVTQCDHDSIALAKLTRQSTAPAYKTGPVEYVDVPR